MTLFDLRGALCVTSIVTLFGLAGCDSGDQKPTDASDESEFLITSEPIDYPDPLIPREHLFDNPQRTLARISPDGTKVAFLAPLNGVLNAWVGPVDNINEAEPVTEDTGRGVQYIQWSAGGTHLLHYQDKDGNESWHVFATELATKTTRDLTPVDDAQISARLSELSWDKPNKINIQINDRDSRYHDIYIVDLESGERELILKNDGYPYILSDNTLTPRIAMRTNENGSATILKIVEGEDWPILSEIPSQDVFGANVVSFSHDNEKIYLISAADRDTTALYEEDIVNGTSKLIGASHRADIQSVLVHPTEKTIEAYSIDYDREEWITQSEEIANTLGYLSTVSDGDFTVVNKSKDNTLWMVHYDVTDAPGVYYLVNVAERTAKKVFGQRPALEDAPLSKMHPRVITSRDELELVSYLTLPPHTDPDGDGIPNTQVPLVLVVHGGPWSRDKFGFDGRHQWLANRGYAVLSVNYRGSTGFGKAFVEAANQEFAKKMHDDLIDSVDWAIAKGIADPDRVAILGSSYGGYATLVGMTFTPERFACGVDISGASNLVKLIESFPDYWGPSLNVTWYPRVGDPRTEEGRELLMSRSPITMVKDIENPLIIFQGANDQRIKLADSDEFVSAMQENGQSVTYAIFEDEGHEFVRPENKMAYHAVAEVFLAQCLGGRYEPIGDALVGSSIQLIAGADRVEGLEEALAARTP